MTKETSAQRGCWLLGIRESWFAFFDSLVPGPTLGWNSVVPSPGQGHLYFSGQEPSPRWMGVLNKTPAGALSWWREQRKEVMMPRPEQHPGRWKLIAGVFSEEGACEPGLDA